MRTHANTCTPFYVYAISLNASFWKTTVVPIEKSIWNHSLLSVNLLSQYKWLHFARSFGWNRNFLPDTRLTLHLTMIYKNKLIKLLNDAETFSTRSQCKYNSHTYRTYFYPPNANWSIEPNLKRCNFQMRELLVTQPYRDESTLRLILVTIRIEAKTIAILTQLNWCSYLVNRLI